MSKYHQARKDIRLLASFVKGLAELDVELEALGGMEKVVTECEGRVKKAQAEEADARSKAETAMGDLAKVRGELETLQSKAKDVLSQTTTEAHLMREEAKKLLDQAQVDADAIRAKGASDVTDAIRSARDAAAEHNIEAEKARAELAEIENLIADRQATLDGINRDLDALSAKLGRK